MRKFWIIISVCWLWTCGGGSSSPTEPQPPKLPTVTNLDLETAEDTSLNFTLQGTEPSGLNLTYAFSSTPSNGQVTLNGAQATYNPNANYNGTDTFGYIATSTSGSSTIGTISITITPVDDEPSTMDASATTDEDNAVDITFDVTEVDGQNVTFSVTNNASNGSVSIAGNIATYTPNQHWNGTDQFNFQVEDASGKRILNTATATIIVNPVNDAPTVVNVTAQMDENKVNGRYQPVTITLAGADVDGDNLSYAIVNNPSNGTVQADGTATVIYTPNQDYNGEDTFTYKANDGTVDSYNNASVIITINSVNDAPVIENLNFELFSLDQIDIFLNGEDIENDILSYEIVNQPSKGSAELEGNIITYINSQSGIDNFSYRAYDGNDYSNEGNILITINETKFFGDQSVDDFGHSIKISSDGGYVVAGSTRKNDSDYDVFVFKTDSSGDLVWMNTFNESADIWQNSKQEAFDLDVTSDGGYILTGYNASSLYLIKIDGNGNKEWSKTTNPNDCNPNKCLTIMHSVKHLLDYGFIIAGVSEGNNIGQEMYLVRTDSFGDELWSKKIGMGGGDSINEKAFSVEETDDGGFILVGSKSDEGVYVVKTDQDGNKEWEKTYSNIFYEGRSIQKTFDGGYIITGTNSGGNLDTFMYLMKIDSNGNIEWSQAYGETNYSLFGYSSKQTNDGGLIIAGSYNTNNNLSRGLFLIKTDQSGNQVWYKDFHSFQSEFYRYGENVTDVEQSTDGGFILLGNSNSFGSGSCDVVLIKTDSEGNRIF
jgi:hypothetical protein